MACAVDITEIFNFSFQGKTLLIYFSLLFWIHFRYPHGLQKFIVKRQKNSSGPYYQSNEDNLVPVLKTTDGRLISNVLDFAIPLS